jgi:hypothetical protein
MGTESEGHLPFLDLHIYRRLDGSLRGYGIKLCIKLIAVIRYQMSLAHSIAEKYFHLFKMF